MGRSEAPLDRDYQEAIPGRLNRKLTPACRSKRAPGQETLGRLEVERVSGVEYKYNRQGTVLQCNSIQTTLSETSPITLML